MKPSAPPATAMQDALRMAGQHFSLPNIRRQLTQKHHLTPAALDAILKTLTPAPSAPVDAQCQTP